MLKKFFTERFFNWTEKDVTDWERIREKGLGRFVWGYGLVLFGGGLFVLLGGVALLFALNQSSFSNILPELIFIALVCLLGGLITGLSTWAMEEKLYQKFKKIHSQGKA